MSTVAAIPTQIRHLGHGPRRGHLARVRSDRRFGRGGRRGSGPPGSGCSSPRTTPRHDLGRSDRKAGCGRDTRPTSRIWSRRRRPRQRCWIPGAKAFVCGGEGVREALGDRGVEVVTEGPAGGGGGRLDQHVRLRPARRIDDRRALRGTADRHERRPHLPDARAA